MLRSLLVLLAAGTTPALAMAEPLAATFELRTQSGSDARRAEFRLVRDASVVEVHDAQTGLVERWERESGSGRLYYLRLFPDVRRAIEFQPNDFGAAQVTSDWDVVRTVIGSAALDRLKPRGERRVAGHRARRYAGEIDGFSVDVDWMADVELPARVQRTAPGFRQELRLTTLQRGPDAAAQLISPGQLKSYEVIDFADLGDRHGDPFVDRVIQASGLQLHAH
jgi:hypothetical protein